MNSMCAQLTSSVLIFQIEILITEHAPLPREHPVAYIYILHHISGLYSTDMC